MVSLNLYALPEEIILKILEDADYSAILACKHVRFVTLVILSYHASSNVTNVLGWLDMQMGVRCHIQVHQFTIYPGACRQWHAAWFTFSFPRENALLGNARSARDRLANAVVDR